MAPASSGLAKPLRGRLLTLAPSLLGGSAWALHGERASATAGGSGPGRSGSSCGRQREGNGLQSRQIELTRRMADRLKRHESRRRTMAHVADHLSVRLDRIALDAE